LCASANIITLRRMKWAGHVARMSEIIAYKILVWKPERKRETAWKT